MQINQLLFGIKAGSFFCINTQCKNSPFNLVTTCSSHLSKQPQQRPYDPDIMLNILFHPTMLKKEFFWCLIVGVAPFAFTRFVRLGSYVKQSRMKHLQLSDRQNAAGISHLYSARCDALPLSLSPLNALIILMLQVWCSVYTSIPHHVCHLYRCDQLGDELWLVSKCVEDETWWKTKQSYFL